MLSSVMRTTGALAIGCALLSTAACAAGAANQAGCDRMKTEMDKLGPKVAQNARNPAALAKVYTATAIKIRFDARRATGDVNQTGKDLASTLDDLSIIENNIATGQAPAPDPAALTNAEAAVKKACGFR